MRVSLKWLKELVEVDVPVVELADRLDMTGTKVEAIHTLGASLTGVVIGQVLEKAPHPDAEKLSYCTVDVGAEEPLKIVCGAQNFSAGDKVPVATIGAELPGGMVIKRAKLRGVESQGMMCSARELEAGGDAAGLMILPEDAPVGAPFAEYCGLGDVVLELEVTPNRPDCLSMAGVAREVAAVLGTTSIVPASAPEESGRPVEELVDVEIEDPDLCARYTARLITGVTVGPSPDWLVERITAAGARPINNIVDVTNYVLFELGQPLHAFDSDTLGIACGRTKVVVRLAQPNERLVTLDGQERVLSEDTLVIADPNGPVALAGVMGGAETEVGPGTVNVLLESASFQTSSVSRTSRRLGLMSEASSRFEKGVDPELAARASDRAAQLIAELAGGTVHPGIVDVYPRRRASLTLTLRLARLDAVLGTMLPGYEAAEILERLGMRVTTLAGGDLEVVVPTFRPDIDREIDLVEEVVRIFGMENVPSTLPGGRGRVGGLSPRQRHIRTMGEALRASGLSEHIGLAFADAADMERLGWELGPGEIPVALLNPMSEEQAVMRWTLASDLLRVVADNQRHGVRDVHAYTVGDVFWTSDGRKLPKERTMLGGVLAGAWQEAGWNQPAAPLDFFDGKGAIESLMEMLGIDRWKVRASVRPWLQRGRSADVLVGGDVIGWLGEVAPRVLDAFEADGPVTLFELSVDALDRAAKDERQYRDIPRLPAVQLDLAIVVPEDVTAERVAQAIGSAGGKLLESARLFDVFREAADTPEDRRRIPTGHKSVAFALTYRAPDRTLTDEEVRSVHDRLVRKVTGAVGGEVRG